MLLHDVLRPEHLFCVALPVVVLCVVCLNARLYTPTVHSDFTRTPPVYRLDTPITRDLQHIVDITDIAYTQTHSLTHSRARNPYDSPTLTTTHLSAIRPSCAFRYQPHLNKEKEVIVSEQLAVLGPRALPRVYCSCSCCS